MRHSTKGSDEGRVEVVRTIYGLREHSFKCRIDMHIYTSLSLRSALASSCHRDNSNAFQAAHGQSGDNGVPR